MNIYELTEQFAALNRMLDEAETPEDLEAAQNCLGSLSGDAGDVIESYCKMICNVKADQGAIDSEIERLQSRSKIMDDKVTRLRDGIKTIMELGGYKKMTGALFSVTLADGSTSVEVFNQDELPDQYVKVTTNIAPDKKAISSAIKEGLEVPGARLMVGAKSIRIK